jgi:hypothetical protein
MTVVVQNRPIRVSREVEAQAETFWTAFQALPPEVQWVVRERLARAEMVSPALAAELESWQRPRDWKSLAQTEKRPQPLDAKRRP